MSDRAHNSGSQSDKPLFHGMDEKERVYAPEEVPGADIPAEERDVGGTAASSTGAASHSGAGNHTDADADRGNIAGAEGNQGTTPVVAVRPDVSANTPIMVPATPDERRLDNDDTTNRT